MRNWNSWNRSFVRVALALAVFASLAGPASAERSFLTARGAPPPLAVARLAALARHTDQSRGSEREEREYQRAMKAIDDRQWDRAVDVFNEVIGMNGARADGALYWKAWALNKQGSRAEALSTLEDLKKRYARSSWTDEAKALEVEIRQASGQPVRPEAQADEETRLVALNALMHTEEERAIPMLEKLLQGADSPRIQERALFVLAQSRSPRAREVLAAVARGSRNPDLQEKAIQYLGIHGSRENRALLEQLYGQTTNVAVRKRILRAFMVSGEKTRLLSVARTEKDPELRGEAVRQLGVMGAQQELWELYQQESSVEVKRNILQALFVGGGSDRLIELAKTEKDPQLRRVAVRNLGLMGSERTAQAIVAIYTSDKDSLIRKEAINALFLQGNARALVGLARKETDLAMKKEIVGKLSIMNSKEGTEYLLELLNKKGE